MFSLQIINLYKCLRINSKRRFRKGQFSLKNKYIHFFWINISCISTRIDHTFLIKKPISFSLVTHFDFEFFMLI